jgi:hypothetical protein
MARVSRLFLGSGKFRNLGDNIMENTNNENTVKKHKRWSIKEFAEGFVKNTLGKKTKEGNYSIATVNGLEALIYTAYCGGSRNVHATEVEGMETLAVRLPTGVVLANSARLKWVGTAMHWGSRSSSRRGQQPVQKFLDEAGAMSVPFNILTPKTANGVSLAQKDPQFDKVQIVEKAPAEEIVITVDKSRYDKEGKYIAETVDEKRHYTGACLLKIEEDYYLFDIDRNELKHKIFNPFMVKLSKPASTVAEAYDILIPDGVKSAKERGADVQRQGEWFFVKRFEELPNPLSGVPKELQEIIDNVPDCRKMGFPDYKETQYGATEDTYKPGGYISRPYGDERGDAIELYDKYQEAVGAWGEAKRKARDYSVNTGQLRQGNSRPNNVEKFVIHNGTPLCSGTIVHTGREHKDLVLTGWYEAVPNTAVGSWQISGDID